MLSSQLVTAVIPVRAGSKGIRGKNLRRVGRDTLLERTIKLAKRSHYIDRVLVSTDDPEMYALAQTHHVAAPSLRPAELATDTATTIDVLLQLIDSVPIQTGYILLLQVTSPLRTLADLNACCEAFARGVRDGQAEAIVSLVRHDAPHPNKIQKIERGFVTSYLETNASVARQSLPEVFSLNGAFYLIHRDTLITQRTLLPEKTLPFIMPPERSINLDSQLDLDSLEALLEKGLLSIEEYN